MSLQRFRTLARNWEAFGDHDPFFGILSDPTRFGGQWGVDEFFESGRAHVNKLVATLANLGVDYARGDCLDFGCGVGRLTIPLADFFRHTVGVDVAKSMIDVARRHNPIPARCEFVVNRSPDLSRFPAASFDLVHSCLVLQHIPPEITLRYVAEFLRVARPGGLVVFQLPAERYEESSFTGRYALPDDGYAARIVAIDPPSTARPGEPSTIRVQVTNVSSVVWRHDIPAGRHICIANHWLNEDGAVEVPDDGRAFLPQTLSPGETCEVRLRVQAPAAEGSRILEIDLVQERVCWFAQKGSATLRIPVTVSGAPVLQEPSSDAGTPQAGPRGSLLRRLLRPFRRGKPTFEMHVVPRTDVENVIRNNGGRLLHAIDDGAAGYRWLSYTYVVRKT